MVLLRRVQGTSMAPALLPGALVIAFGWPLARRAQAGDIVIVQHKGLEKIKRLYAERPDEIYVLGDNAAASTDSRHFGWLPRRHLQAVVIWPKQKHLRPRA